MKKIYLFLLLLGFWSSKFAFCQVWQANNNLPNLDALKKKVEKRNKDVDRSINRLLKNDYKQLFETDNKLINTLNMLDSNRSNLFGIALLIDEKSTLLQKSASTAFTEQQERLKFIVQYFENQNSFERAPTLAVNQELFLQQGLNNNRLNILEKKTGEINERFGVWKELLPNEKINIKRLNILNERLGKKLKKIQFKNTLLSKAESALLEKAPDIPGFETYFLSHSTFANVFQLNAPAQLDISLSDHLQTVSLNEQLVHRIQQLDNTAKKNESNTGESMEIKTDVVYLNNTTDKISDTATVKKSKPDNTSSDSKTEIRFRPDFQINRTENILPNISQIGLSIFIKPAGKKWEFGQSLVTMAGWPGGNHNHFTIEGIGYRSFFEWPLLNQTKLYTGIEFSLLTRLIPEGQLKSWPRYLVGSGLVGINRNMQIGKQRIEMLVAYDIWYKQNPIQTSPWVVRTGINLFNKPL